MNAEPLLRDPIQISSTGNPKIKELRAIRQSRKPASTPLHPELPVHRFLVEGIRHVGELVEAQAVGKTYARLEALYAAPELLKSEFGQKLFSEQSQRGLPCYTVTKEVFASVAEKDNPQGLLAVAQPTPPRLEDLFPAGFPWLTALVAPQDPGNIGTILRTIDAVGASGLLLLENSADPYHPSSIRASMGTSFWLPVISTSFGEFIQWARRYDYRLYGTSAHGALNYRGGSSATTNPTYTRPCVLLMGSEREGLTAEQRTACDFLIGLPMRGRATSLNLAVAAGVMLYTMAEKSSADCQ